jgi:hypothetical protein
LGNHPSALQHPDFVEKAIADLIATRAAMEWPLCPLVVSPLGVVPKKGSAKYRLIFDGRYVNDHLSIPTFSYETLSHMHSWARPGDYAFTIDLTSGFHHLMMHESAWPYLGFQWNGKYYVFTSAPFGLATVPWAFTLLVRSVLDHCRRLGHRCTSYIDDSMWFHQYKDKLADLRQFVLTLFADLGFCVNFDKSVLRLLHQHIYLGMQVDLALGIFTVPPEKRAKLMAAISDLLAARGPVQVRELASVKGKIASMSWAFGLAAKFFTKSMDRDICGAPTWCSRVALSEATTDELRFWQAQFDRFNGIKPIWADPKVDLVVHVDAAGRSNTSGGGWGAWCVRNDQTLTAGGVWHTAADSAMSSSAQELQACLLALQSFHTDAQPLNGVRVQLVTDSFNAALALNHGRVYALDSVRVVQEIFMWCMVVGVHLSSVWVPREDNVLADALSKAIDPSDCMLDPVEFRALHEQWGPFTVDLFASQTSRQLDAYYSKQFTPDTMGVDAFAVDWGPLGCVWVNPPFSLIASAWAYAAHCQAYMCLVVPYWPTKPWWRLLVPGADRKLSEPIRAITVLQARKGLVVSIDNNGNRAKKPKANWPLLALLVDFRTFAPGVPVGRPLLELPAELM